MPNEKHLEFLQDAITRMAEHSFQMKAWSVAVATAAIGFAAAKDSLPDAAILGIVPIVAFWGLDGYYLMLERGMRTIYNSVRSAATSNFEMMPSVSPKAWLDAWISPPVVLVHLPMAIVVFLVARG
jgi:hypothetical protein